LYRKNGKAVRTTERRLLTSQSGREKDFRRYIATASGTLKKTSTGRRNLPVGHQPPYHQLNVEM
jgi:hypothetical protein